MYVYVRLLSNTNAGIAVLVPWEEEITDIGIASRHQDTREARVKLVHLFDRHVSCKLDMNYMGVIDLYSTVLPLYSDWCSSQLPEDNSTIIIYE